MARGGAGGASAGAVPPQAAQPATTRPTRSPARTLMGHRLRKWVPLTLRPGAVSVNGGRPAVAISR